MPHVIRRYIININNEQRHISELKRKVLYNVIGTVVTLGHEQGNILLLKRKLWIRQSVWCIHLHYESQFVHYRFPFLFLSNQTSHCISNSCIYKRKGLLTYRCNLFMGQFSWSPDCSFAFVSLCVLFFVIYFLFRFLVFVLGSLYYSLPIGKSS